MFDIPIVRINGMNNGNLEQQKQFNIQFGLLSSALEHATPEMMFTNAQNPGEAISAVKALQKANAAGQKIYHITQANMASVLPNIHHHSDTMEEIQNALNAGKEVITHTDAVSVPGWSGAGYIILDPVTGDGAYKIGGGANGGVLIFLSSVILFFVSLVAIANPVLLVFLLYFSILGIGKGLSVYFGDGSYFYNAKWIAGFFLSVFFGVMAGEVIANSIVSNITGSFFALIIGYCIDILAPK